MKNQVWKRELVPQVAETNLEKISIPKKSIGFTYLWTNLTTGMWYYGKHEGYPRDGYLFSSKQKEFLRDFTNLEYTWRYEIMEFTTTNKDDLTNLEFKKLSLMHDPKTNKGGAAKNPMSYNKSNGIPVKTKEPNLKKVQNLARRIINEEFPIRLKIEISFLLLKIQKDERIQGRRKDKFKHIQDITGFINDAGGITDPCPIGCDRKHEHIIGCDPVVMLHNVTYRGKFHDEIIVDGSQTIQGASRAKKAVYLRVQDVPPEETDDFTDGEKVMLSNALNPPQQKKKDPTDRDDFEDYMEGQYYNEGLPVNSDNHIETGKKLHGLHGNTVTAAIQTVEDKIEKDEHYVRTGEVFCDYDTPAYKPKLEKMVKKLNNIPGVYCYPSKTSFYKVDKTIRELNSLVKQMEEDPSFVIHEMRILHHHPGPKAKKEFKPIIKEHEEWNKNIFSKTGINVEFVYMPEYDLEDED